MFNDIFQRCNCLYLHLMFFALTKIFLKFGEDTKFGIFFEKE